VVGELRRLVVPADLELPLLHPVVEPRTAEDELLQPVDERLAVDEGDLVPVANEVAAERAAGLFDGVPLDELDQVGRLVVVQLVPCQQAELDGGRRDALLEVRAVEAEAVAQELDDVVLAGAVVRLRVHAGSVPLARAHAPASGSPSQPSSASSS